MIVFIAYMCAGLMLIVGISGLIAWAWCGAADFPEDRQ